jgi:hypothetical protein
MVQSAQFLPGHHTSVIEFIQFAKAEEDSENIQSERKYYSRVICAIHFHGSEPSQIKCGGPKSRTHWKLMFILLLEFEIVISDMYVGKFRGYGH